MKTLLGIGTLFLKLIEVIANKPTPAKSDTVKKAAEEWNERKRRF